MRLLSQELGRGDTQGHGDSLLPPAGFRRPPQEHLPVGRGDRGQAVRGPCERLMAVG